MVGKPGPGTRSLEKTDIRQGRETGWFTPPRGTAQLGGDNGSGVRPGFIGQANTPCGELPGAASGDMQLDAHGRGDTHTARQGTEQFKTGPRHLFEDRAGRLAEEHA